MSERSLSPTCQDAEIAESVAYLYDGTLEGLLTCVFRSYENHIDPTDISPAANFQPRIGQFVTEIQTDAALAMRVANGLCRVAGNDAYNLVKVVGLSCTPDFGLLTLAFVRYAMKAGHGWDRDIMHPAVEPMLRIKRAMSSEKERMLQFIRFEELDGGLWLATCNPKANIVPFIMDHFAARFNTQCFIIYDEVHHLAGVHEGPEPYRSRDAGNDGEIAPRAAANEQRGDRKPTHSLGSNRWYLVPTEGTGFTDNLPKRSENEQLMRRAWQTFYDNVSVEARYNPELRVHWMPKRLWKNITEMRDD